MNERILFGLLFIGVAIAQVVPHPYNFSPVGAFALFAGAYLADKRLLAVPLVALLVSDLTTGLYAAVVMVFVYAGFAASTLMGRLLLLQKKSPARIAAGVVSGAITFYLISNIGMWLYAYPLTIAGYLACITDGLAFLARSIVGDAVYAILLFGAMQWTTRHASGTHRHAATQRN